MTEEQKRQLKLIEKQEQGADVFRLLGEEKKADLLDKMHQHFRDMYGLPPKGEPPS